MRRAALTCLLIAAAASGCSTAPSRFYTLDSTAAADGLAATPVRVVVGPVTIPGSVDRPQFVVQVAPNRVEFDEFNRWAAPLDESIARVVAVDLVTLLRSPDVATAPLANFAPTYRVTIEVQRFETVPAGSVGIEAVWVVQRVQNGETRAGRTVAQLAAAQPGFDALAAAHSQALARLSADIAAAIRAMASAG